MIKGVVVEWSGSLYLLTLAAINRCKDIVEKEAAKLPLSGILIQNHIEKHFLKFFPL